METRILSVGSAKRNKMKCSPRIRIIGIWLNSIGFKHNKLVQVTCSENNILLKIVEENAVSHYDISRKILKTDSEGILHVASRWRKSGTPTPYIFLVGDWLLKFGFKIGDVIATQYEHGIINIRRIDLAANKISN